MERTLSSKKLFQKAFYNLRVCCKTNKKKTRKILYNIAANEFKTTLRVCSTTNLKQIKLLQDMQTRMFPSKLSESLMERTLSSKKLFQKAFYNLRVCCKTNKKKTRKILYNIAANEFKTTLRVCSTTNLKQIKLLRVVESSSMTPFCKNVL